MRNPESSRALRGGVPRCLGGRECQSYSKSSPHQKTNIDAYWCNPLKSPGKKNENQFWNTFPLSQWLQQHKDDCFKSFRHIINQQSMFREDGVYRNHYTWRLFFFQILDSLVFYFFVKMSKTKVTLTLTLKIFLLWPCSL